MNPLWRKEIRALLPTWGLALALAILPVWLLWPGKYDGYNLPSPGGLLYVLYSAGVVLLAVTPFGHELSHGTFSLLLAQPVPRLRFWRAKTTVLGVALVVVFAAYFISNLVRVDLVLDGVVNDLRNTYTQASALPDEHAPRGRAEAIRSLIGHFDVSVRQSSLISSLVFGGLSVLAAFAGGLWTTLLFRQISAAMWFAFFLPLGLGALALELFRPFSADGVYAALAGTSLAISAYTVAGYFLAKRLFLRAEDVQWTGGIIALPSLHRRGVKARLAAGRNHRPVRALLWNELQAQHINLILAAGLVAVHVGVLLFRRIARPYVDSHLNLGLMLEFFPLLWLAVPLVIGSVAVAEERKLGTIEGQLCLPVTRRVQFAIKLLMALALGSVLGGIVPVVVENVGRAVLGLQPPREVPLLVRDQMYSVGLIALLGPAALTLIGLFGSSLARNALQAMGIGLAVAVSSLAAVSFTSQPFWLGGVLIWAGPLAKFVGTVVLVPMLTLLAYANYRQVRINSRHWRINVLALAITLFGAATATSMVYHRFWEVWLPEEPRHGPRGTSPLGLNTRFTTNPKIQFRGFRTVVLLPDERLWLSEPTGKPRPVPQQFELMSPIPTGPVRSGFIHGSNWVDVALSDHRCFALKRDGSLWEISGSFGSLGGFAEPKAFGEPGARWKQVAAGDDHFAAVERDGTLWEWGVRILASGDHFSSTNFVSPIQLGTDADWAAVADSYTTSVGVKTNGTIWQWRMVYDWDSGRRQYVSRHADVPELCDRLPVPCDGPAFLDAAGGRTLATICADGTLWVEGFPWQGAEREDRLVRWGADSRWVQCRFTMGAHRLIAVSQFGMLCDWHPFQHTRSGPQLLPHTPSRYADWIAVAPYHNTTFLALAADGSLCQWGSPEGEDFANSSDDAVTNSLLARSRIRARLIADLW